MRIQLIGDLVVSVVYLLPLIRIHRRAGVDARLALLVLVPFFGLVISGLVLSFSKWHVAKS